MLYNLALIDCKAQRFISQTLQGIKLFGATMYFLTELEGRTGKACGARSRRTGSFFFLSLSKEIVRGVVRVIWENCLSFIRVIRVVS